VILAVLLITALFAWRVPYLSFKTSVYDLIIEDLPETARYEAFKEIFGSDELIRVVVKADNLFDAPPTSSSKGWWQTPKRSRGSGA
jgi:predicted RND superfamily exporter protein